MVTDPVIRLRTRTVLEELKNVHEPACPSGGFLQVYEAGFTAGDYAQMAALIRQRGYKVMPLPDEGQGIEVMWQPQRPAATRRPRVRAEPGPCPVRGARVPAWSTLL